MMQFWPIFLLLFFASQTIAGEYKVDYQQSRMQFSGVHAGNEFQGDFRQWTMAIQWAQKSPQASVFNAVFDLSTAKTGNKLYDGTLPQIDWFYTKKYPEATFSSKMVTGTDGTFNIQGDLTIRDITLPVTFEVIPQIDGDQLTLSGQLVIDRLAYDIGKDSDPIAEWVSREIVIDFHVVGNAE